MNDSNFLYVFDNAVSSELYDKVSNDIDFFPSVMDGENIGETNNYYHSQESSCYAPYMFWDGWWSSPPNTLRKKVIQEIWDKPGRIPFPLHQVKGFEYWVRTFSPGQYLRVHVDEDTFLYAKENVYNAPSLGCVWYGTTEASGGGFLELHESSLSPGGLNSLERNVIDPLLSPIERRERIAYKPNRVVIFDAGKRLHEATEFTSGFREVMVINVWHVDTPPSGLFSDDFYYE